MKSLALFAVVAALVAFSPISVSADVIDDEPTPGLEPARRPSPAPPPPPPPAAKPAPPPPPAKPVAKPAAPAPAPAPARAASDDWKRNHVSMFLSSVSEDDFDTTEFNGGLEYEYQFVKYAGIGVQVEGATGIRNMVALVPIFIHPWKGLRFTVGGGARLDEDNDSDGMMRVGVGYRFNLTESITLAPEYNADLYNLTDSTDVDHVFGVRLGYQF